MKKFLVALIAAGTLIFSGQSATEAATENLNGFTAQNVETQELGKWAHFRDKYILGRETENERRDRREWERRHHYYDDYNAPRRGYYPPPPPPHRPYHHNRHW
ncbi:MAG: hypothetical protein K6G55_01955 [Selenomonadaceae bacterium]|nr:hypothetical protein [Selenomonadaceae bacterium]